MINVEDDPIREPASIETVLMRAWRIEQHFGSGAVVAIWLIEAPSAHPFWHSYQLSIVHLRPDPALPDPVIYLPGATHEMVLSALDPSQPRQEIFDLGLSFPMIPANFAAQLICADDDAAAAMGSSVVAMIGRGDLNPDTDDLKSWIALFGDNMIRR